MGRWPRDNQAELINFYGTPGPQVERQLVDVVPPFEMTYDGHKIKAVRFHKKAAQALRDIFAEIWDRYGHSQQKIDSAGVSKFAGSYNPRKVRGSATKWSNHAFGAAIDLNAEQNGMYAKGNMPPLVVQAFKRQGFRWGGDYKGRKDPMHFEACDNGERPVAATPVSFMQTDADGDSDSDESDRRDVDSSDVSDDAGPSPIPPVSMAKSKIGNTSAVVGTGATVLGGAQIASSIIGPIGDVADQVQTVTDHAGNVINTTKTIVSIPKPGFWNALIHMMTSPAFVGCTLLLMAVACIGIWFWRRQHRQQGV